MWLFIVGGALTVTVTFMIVAAFARAGAERYARAQVSLAGAAIGVALLHSGTRTVLKAFGVAALALAIVAGLAGNQDPSRNIAPTLVWIVWWVEIGRAHV